jgi:hypothetical protein
MVRFMSTEQKKKVTLKKKTAQVNPEVKLELGDTFDVASAKDKDFDLDMDAATFTGKKGQAGSRSRLVGGGGGDMDATRATA